MEKTRDVHIRLGAFEHSVLVPAWFTDPEVITRSFQRRHVLGFLGGAGHHEHDIYNRLGREHGGAC